ncbi:MAG TPA: hypothetical protein VFY04_02635 [Solirubrobacterales bacterium]|nr:hypothetical protein [Solirubrobacterales bacterium]
MIPEQRPEDAHDVLGTFGVVTDPALRGQTPTDADDFAELLKLLNRRILEGRPDKAPGEWKQRSNRAGGTGFVAPEARCILSPTATDASPAPCSTPRWASLVDWSGMARATVQLERSNALVAPDEAEERGLTLRDPA